MHLEVPLEDVELPLPLEEIFIQLRETVNGEGFMPMRDLIRGLIDSADAEEALVLRDQLVRLRSVSEAMVQVAQEAYAARG